MISVSGLGMRFGNRQVLADINLDVADGEIVAIMGSSGGGKTTLLRCISGLIRPTSGMVQVDGIDVAKRPEEARKCMGLVFQSAALFDYMPVGQNVLFGIRRRLKAKPDEAKRIAEEALARVGLQGSEPLMPAELSGGMRKRVGIARAIALKPKVMLYDEPTTGLDPITTYNIDGLIATLRETLSVTSLIVSHDVTSVFRVADRIAFLHEGRLIFSGTAEEFRDSRETSIRELIEKSEAASLSSASSDRFA